MLPTDDGTEQMDEQTLCAFLPNRQSDLELSITHYFPEQFAEGFS